MCSQFDIIYIRWISPILWDLGDRGGLEGKTFNPIRQSEQHGKVKCGGSRIWRRKAIHNFSSRCLQISQTPHSSRRSKYFFLGILHNLANMTLFEGLRERIELKMRKRKFEGGAKVVSNVLREEVGLCRLIRRLSYCFKLSKLLQI